MAEKNYRSATGLDEFYYAKLLETKTAAAYTEAIERIKFFQTVNIEQPQEMVEAWGDNEVAEQTVSNGKVTITTSFHSIPQVDKDVLFGLEVVEGLSSYGNDDTPPYVACVFAKTYEDGSRSWIGLTKGMFMKNSTEGSTKEETAEFSSDEVEGSFIDREVDGFTVKKSRLYAHDPKGSTVGRDALFMKVFGLPYPGTVGGA